MTKGLPLFVNFVSLAAAATAAQAAGNEGEAAGKEQTGRGGARGVAGEGGGAGAARDDTRRLGLGGGLGLGQRDIGDPHANLPVAEQLVGLAPATRVPSGATVKAKLPSART